MGLTRRRLLAEGTWLAAHHGLRAACLGGCATAVRAPIQKPVQRPRRRRRRTGAFAWAARRSPRGAFGLSSVRNAGAFRRFAPHPRRSWRPTGRARTPDDPRRQIPFYRVAMREGVQSAHRDLPPTRVWGYGATLPGSYIETRSGQGIRKPSGRRVSRVPFPSDRLHAARRARRPARGADRCARARRQGGTEERRISRRMRYAPGQSTVSHYPARQDVVMLWYHDHAYGHRAPESLRRPLRELPLRG